MMPLVTTILLPCAAATLQATSGASLAIERTAGYARVRPEEAGVLVLSATTPSYSSTLATDPHSSSAYTRVWLL